MRDEAPEALERPRELARRLDEALRHLCGRLDVNKFPELRSFWSAPRSAAHYFTSLFLDNFSPNSHT